MSDSNSLVEVELQTGESGDHEAKDAEAKTEHYDYLFKLLLIGDSAVGKSSLMLRFVDDSFDASLAPTIGVDFKIRTVTTSNGKKVKLQVWDTAGQERFRSVAKSYYKHSHGIIVVYDTTRPETFKNISFWLAEIDTHASHDVEQILVGNKCDLTDSRKVSTEEGANFADKAGLRFIESSARANTNVDTMFQEIAERIQSNLVRRPHATVQKVKQIESESVTRCCT